MEKQYSSLRRSARYNEVRWSFSSGLRYRLLYGLQEEKGETVPEACWPENGDQWSDREDEGELEESGLIQEMVEEDEEIDLYNEETFGLGHVAYLVLGSCLDL